MSIELQIGTLALTGIGPTEGPSGLKIVPSSQLQVSPAIGADGIDIFDRKNYSHVITFSVERQHLSGGRANFDAAALFVSTHNLAVQKVGRSVFTKKTSEGTVYYTPAVAMVTSSSSEGCRTFHSYKIIAGIVTTSAPAGASGGSLTTGNPTYTGGGYQTF